MHKSYNLEGTEPHLSDLDPKVKVKGKTAGICDGVPSTSALVLNFIQQKTDAGTFFSKLE